MRLSHQEMFSFLTHLNRHRATSEFQIIASHCHLIRRTLRWLWQLLMVRVCHISPQFYQDSLHGVAVLPVAKARQLGWVDLFTKPSISTSTESKRSCVYTYHAILRVDTRQVDLVLELDGRWLIWVFGTAVHGQGVDSVLVDALRGDRG